MKQTRQADVVQIVPHRLGQGAGLAPAGDATEHQGGIALLQDVGPITQALHHPGSKSLDHSVGLFDQSQDAVPVGRVLQIDGNGGAAPVQHRAAHLIEGARAHGRRAAETQHLGAQIGQHHAGEGDGAQTVELQDA